MTEKITIDRAVIQKALDKLENICPYYTGDDESLNKAKQLLIKELAKRNQCGETCERAKLCAICASEIK